MIPRAEENSVRPSTSISPAGRLSSNRRWRREAWFCRNPKVRRSTSPAHRKLRRHRARNAPAVSDNAAACQALLLVLKSHSEHQTNKNAKATVIPEQDVRFRILAQLDETINRQRQRLGLAWIFPANKIVAPNSPSARENASSAPATMPLYAKGIVMTKKIRSPEAPSVAAICSSRGFTSAKEVRTDRTSKRKGHHRHGDQHAFPVENDLYAAVVEPLAEGTSPAEYLQQDQPVDTGGMTSGSRTMVSNTLLSGHSLRAKAMPTRYRREESTGYGKPHGNRKECDLPGFKSKKIQSL